MKKDASILRHARGRRQQRSGGHHSASGGASGASGASSGGGGGGAGDTITPPSAAAAVGSSRNSVTWSTASSLASGRTGTEVTATTAATTTIGAATTTRTVAAGTHGAGATRSVGSGAHGAARSYAASSAASARTTASASAPYTGGTISTTTSLLDRNHQVTEEMESVLASARKKPQSNSSVSPFASSTNRRLEMSRQQQHPSPPRRILPQGQDHHVSHMSTTARHHHSPGTLTHQEAAAASSSSTSLLLSSRNDLHQSQQQQQQQQQRMDHNASQATNVVSTRRKIASTITKRTTTTTTRPIDDRPGPSFNDPEQQAPVVQEEEEEEQAAVLLQAEEPPPPPTIDAACLPLGSVFRLGMHHYSGFVSVEPPLQQQSDDKESKENDGDDLDDDYCKVTTRGLGRVGNEDDGFMITPVRCATSHVLCYGDTIALQSPNKTIRMAGGLVDGGEDDDKEEGYYFGVQAMPNRNCILGDSDRLVYEAGLYRSLLHKKANQWEILDASTDSSIQVGLSTAQNAMTTTAKNKSNNRKSVKPVRSGEAFVLRNIGCGGILSVSSEVDSDLIVYTDSYHQIPSTELQFTEENDGDDHSLLGRLERHNEFYPTQRELFHFLLPTVPPMAPLWVMGGSPLLDRRPFLDGTYLLDPHRHDDIMDDSHGADDGMLFLDYSGKLQESGKHQLQTPQGQEIVLVDELIGSFIGLEGSYIRVVDSSSPSKEMSSLADVQFQLVDTQEVQFDVGLRSLVEELLALSTHYVRVNHFTSSRLPGYEYGSVMQALCTTLDDLLQEHCVYIAKQLELQFRGSGMTMRRLQVLVRPSLHSMSVLERVTRAVANEKGGALINTLRCLQVQVYEGDGGADAILSKLLDRASVPYMAMLQKWLDRGILSDPYEEFMIQCNHHDKNDWEGKYSIVKEHLLEGFFSTSVSVDRVLATGKYWNAVCTCRNNNGGRLDRPDPGVDGGRFMLSYHANGTKVSSYIHTMYYKASRALVHLLMGQFNLLGALRLMKRYFLLDQGDFFVNFMDAAEEELSSELSDLSFGRIQHWLNTSVQITEHQDEVGVVMANSSNNGPGQPRQLSPNGLRCRFARDSLMDHLDRLHGSSGIISRNAPITPKRRAYGGIPEEVHTGLEVFMMDFTSIPFPVSLVLSQKAVSQYQLLFRLLFYTKQVERRLVGIWMDHQAMKELPSLHHPALRRSLLLRQRMLHCVNNLIYYMMFEVIEPNWLEMESRIASPSGQKEQTVDDILDVHNQFLERTVEACLLTNRDLVCALTRLLRTCLLFSNQMELFMKQVKIHDDRQRIAMEKQKQVQRSLNYRGGEARIATSADRKSLRGSMHREYLARQERIQEQARRVEREVAQPSYSPMVVRYDEIFSKELRDFLRLLNRSEEKHHSQRVNLCIRLDYNGFLTDLG